jgi:uncharacterized membrane-anchored protein YjiN (DUF445 family)
MTIDEIKAYLTENANDEAVKGFIFDLSLKSKQAIIDEFKSSKDFQAELTREGDRRVQGALDKFQRDTMPKHIEEEIKKRFPDETPEQKAVRELKMELDQIKSQKTKEETRNKLARMLNEKKLPMELQDFINAESEEDISAKVEALNGIFEKRITDGVSERIKTAGMGQPPASAGSVSGVVTSRDDLKKLSREEQNKAISEGRVQIPGVDLSAFKEQ